MAKTGISMETVDIPTTKAPILDKDEMHLDDFLNSVESIGHRELAAAFALYSKTEGFIKLEVSEWEKHFDEFSKMTP